MQSARSLKNFLLLIRLTMNRVSQQFGDTVSRSGNTRQLFRSRQSCIRNRRGVAISGGVGKSLKVNKRGVAISGGGWKKLQGECL